MGKWSSFKEQQMLVESFREFVKEEADPAQLNPKLFPLKLSKVGNAAKVVADPRTKQGLADKDSEDDKVPVASKAFSVSQLKPSQSSMNIEKAVKFVLQMLHPKGKLDLGGDLGAMISKDGFIMDGHHRWVATGMADPSKPVKGFLVQFPAKQLIAVLNAMTLGYFGVSQGKKASGGFEQFNENDIAKQLQIALKRGVWGNLKPEDVQQVLEQFTGVQGDAVVAAAAKKMVTNLSKLTMSTPSWAPERPDMPVIDQPKVAVQALGSGALDVNPPYGKKTRKFAKKTSRGV